MPELVDLELFVATVEGGSITAGAAAVGLSLPAASARIAGLEAHYGVPLLTRHRRGVSATPSGAVLAGHAAAVLDDHRALEREMRARSKGLEDVVRLVANTSAVDALTELLAAVLGVLPTVRVELAEAPSVDALALVARGRADLGVVSDAAPRDGLESRELWADPLVVVGAPGALPDQGGLSLADVVARPMVGLAEDAPLQVLVEREASRAGLTPVHRVRMPSLGAVCEVATTGVGLAVVPAATARRHGVPASGVRPLAEPWAIRRAVLVARTFDALPPAAAGVARFLLEHRDEQW